MTQPSGFVDPTYPDHVCKLDKALYGLKQLPRAQNTKLSASLLYWEIVGSKADTSKFVYTSPTAFIICLVYVDDIIITGSNSTIIDQLIASLHSQFALKDLAPLHYFFGIEVQSIASGLHPTQTKYIYDLLYHSSMHGCNPMSSPMYSTSILSHHDGVPLADGTEYRSTVGALQYCTFTRPDISFAVNKVSQFMHTPTDIHWQAVKRILRYLRGTLHLGLSVQPSLDYNLVWYTDADWASCPNDRRSTCGYSIFL